METQISISWISSWKIICESYGHGNEFRVRYSAYVISIPRKLVTSIEELQRQLDEFRSKLRWAGTSTLKLSPKPHTETSPGMQNNGHGQGSQPRRVTGSHGSDSEEGYAGPTSFTFGMKTADARLLSISENDDDVTRTLNAFTADDKSPVSSDPAVPRAVSEHQFGDWNSLEDFGIDDVNRCLDTFQKVFGILHPISCLDKIRTDARSLLRSARRSLWSQPTSPGQCGLLEMLKIIIAIALVTQNGGPTTLSNLLYRSVEPMVSAAAFYPSIGHDFRVLLLLVVNEPRPWKQVIRVLTQTSGNISFCQ